MFSQDEKNEIRRRVERGFFSPGTTVDPCLFMLVNWFGLTSEFIAAKLGIQQPNISRWLNQKKPVPEIHRLPLLQILDATVEIAKEVLASYETMQKTEGRVTNQDLFHTALRWRDKETLKQSVESAGMYLAFYIPERSER